MPVLESSGAAFRYRFPRRCVRGPSTIRRFHTRSFCAVTFDGSTGKDLLGQREG